MQKLRRDGMRRDQDQVRRRSGCRRRPIECNERFWSIQARFGKCRRKSGEVIIQVMRKCWEKKKRRRNRRRAERATDIVKVGVSRKVQKHWKG